MKNVFITGANGFVGQALCARMLADGWSVRRAVRNQSSIGDLSGVETVQIDSLDLNTDWPEAILGANIVVHLAGQVHETNNTALDSLSAFRRVNVAGTERLARMAVVAGVRRFIYISSVKVNGEPASLDPYSVSKWEAENVLRIVAAETGLDLVILRPPLVYGPDVKANFLRLLNMIYQGIPLPLESVDNQRSLIYLGNLVDAIVTCINHPGAAGQVYFVSDGEDVSTPDLIRCIAAALGRPVRLIPFPPALLRVAGWLVGKSAEIERLLGSLTIDSAKIRHELNWTPPHTLTQGLRETAEWYKKIKGERTVNEKI